MEFLLASLCALLVFAVTVVVILDSRNRRLRALAVSLQMQLDMASEAKSVLSYELQGRKVVDRQFASDDPEYRTEQTRHDAIVKKAVDAYQKDVVETGIRSDADLLAA